MKKYRIHNKFVIIAAFAVAVSCCAACGSKKKTDNIAGMDDGEWIYDPEYLDLEIPDKDGLCRVEQRGDFLYYQVREQDPKTGEKSGSLMKVSLMDGSAERMPLLVDRGELLNYDPKDDGCVYADVLFWNREDKAGWRGLAKYDAAGKEVYQTELEDIMDREGAEYFQDIAADSRGRVYLVSNQNKIFLFDEKGKYAGNVAPGDKGIGIILAVGEGRDGKVYAFLYGVENRLVEIDFEHKKAGASYRGFPGESGNQLSVGTRKDFLLFDKTTVYEYDLAENTVEELFSWKDYSVESSLVRSVGATTDGRVMALLYDWTTEDYEVALMRRTSEEQAKPLQKETIRLAAFSSDLALTKAVTEFNKKSKKYRVVIEEYYSPDVDMDDMRERLSAELLSDAGPDIVNIGLFEEDSIGALVGNGLFEDLSPYLEQSGVLKREDFVEGCVDGNTYGGRLAALPRTFDVYALVIPADEADAGGCLGFSLDALYALADRHPGKGMFLYPGSALYYCMYCNQSAFIDWDTGKCSFDSPEFIRMLEFCKSLNGIEAEASLSTIELIQSGEASVVVACLDRFEKAQYYLELFGGECAFVGYPTVDGSVAFPIYMDTRYGISASSGKKDGAWEFLEFYLTMEKMNYESGFSARKEMMEQEFEAALAVTYATDENGETICDNNGDPIPELSYSASVTDASGWTYHYRQTTREEAELVREIVSRAKPAPDYNRKIEEIISEEASFFYNNAKSAGEVADVIQKRVQLYVNENR